MATSYEYWDLIYLKVRELRSQGLTLLQIEETLDIDYEDVCWAIHQDELLDAMRDIV